MKNTVQILSIAIALLLSWGSLAMAQSSSSASMQIRVEVVSGAQITQAHTDEPFTVQNQETTFGSFNIRVPDGTEILTESEDTVLMFNGSDLWKLNSEVNVESGENGVINLEFTTRNNGQGETRTGTYQGKQVATIQYL